MHPPNELDPGLAHETAVDSEPFGREQLGEGPHRRTEQVVVHRERVTHDVVEPRRTTVFGRCRETLAQHRSLATTRTGLHVDA